MQQIWHQSPARPLVGRMMLDTATATLGMLQLSRPGDGPGPEDLHIRGSSSGTHLVTLPHTNAAVPCHAWVAAEDGLALAAAAR